MCANAIFRNHPDRGPVGGTQKEGGRHPGDFLRLDPGFLQNAPEQRIVKNGQKETDGHHPGAAHTRDRDYRHQDDGRERRERDKIASLEYGAIVIVTNEIQAALQEGGGLVNGQIALPGFGEDRNQAGQKR